MCWICSEIYNILPLRHSDNLDTNIDLGVDLGIDHDLSIEIKLL